MRKLFYLLLALTLTTTSFVSCSSDETETSSINKQELIKERDDLLAKIKILEIDIAELEEKMKTANGGRLIILQNEYYDKIETLNKRKSRLKEVEKDLWT